nr:HAD-IA family hydrolase [Paenibacillus phyllosphaerae]
MTANLTYLPAALRLQEWSRTMDLHLLSNHRTEWLLPVLQPYLSCFKSITISSEAGLAKPNPDLFTRLSNTLPSGAEVIFVDDHERNLEQGRAIGWAGLIADPENKWIDFVDAKAKI